MPKIMEDLLENPNTRRKFKETVNTYVEQFVSLTVEEEERTSLKFLDFFQSSFDDINDNNSTSTLFIFEVLMQRLGLFQSLPLPTESSDLKDHYNKRYSTYDLLLVLIYVYLGLCKGYVLSLPQLRAERLSKKSKTTDQLKRLKALRETASSKLVSVEEIKTLWRRLEPRLLRDHWEYCRMFRRKSTKEGTRGKEELIRFTGGRQAYVANFTRFENIGAPVDKEDKKIQDAHMQSITNLRAKIQAYNRGDDVDISDSDTNEYEKDKDESSSDSEVDD